LPKTLLACLSGPRSAAAFWRPAGALISTLVLAGGLAGSSPAAADDEDELLVYLYVSAEEVDNPAWVSFYLGKEDWSVDQGAWSDKLEAALIDGLGCEGGRWRAEQDDDWWHISGSCAGFWQSRWLSLSGTWRLAPLTAVLSERSTGSLIATWELPASPLAHVEAPAPWRAQPKSAEEEPFAFRLDFHDEEPPVVTGRSGYAGNAVALRLAAWAATLLLPFALLAHGRRKVLRTAVTHVELAWFGLWRKLQWISTGTLFLWLAVFPAFGTWELFGFVLAAQPFWVHLGAFCALLVLPPMVSGPLHALLLLPVFRRLGRGEAVRAQVRMLSWYVTSGPLALVLALTGLATVAGSPRLMLPLLASAWLVRWLGIRQLLRSGDLTPHAVSLGVLRDRVFELARLLGVKLREFYVVPAHRARVANAAALASGHVVMSDFLLQRLGRKEADAVLAHELAHLRRGHPKWLSVALFAAVMTPSVGGALWLTRHNPERLVNSIFSLAPVALALGLLVFLALSRRFELDADADAVLLTREPEAMISALAKLTHMNLLPRAWGRWTARLLTHPSLEERTRAIA